MNVPVLQIGPDVSSSHIPAEFRQILLPCREIVMKPAGSSSPGGLRSFGTPGPFPHKSLNMPTFCVQHNAKRRPIDPARIRWDGVAISFGARPCWREFLPTRYVLHCFRGCSEGMKIRSGPRSSGNHSTSDHLLSILFMTNRSCGDLCFLASISRCNSVEGFSAPDTIDFSH
jgi:hypothetical protein